MQCNAMQCNAMQYNRFKEGAVTPEQGILFGLGRSGNSRAGYPFWVFPLQNRVIIYNAGGTYLTDQGWVPPPPENFFEQANPGHPGNFLSNSLPRGKNDGRIPGVGQNFPKLEETASLAFKKSNKKLRKLRDSTNFLFGELNKTFIFKTEAIPLESL